MRKYALATVMLLGICIISCGLPADKKHPHEQKLENNLVETVQSDSTEDQIRKAEAELKSFLEE